MNNNFLEEHNGNDLRNNIWKQELLYFIQILTKLYTHENQENKNYTIL